MSAYAKRNCSTAPSLYLIPMVHDASPRQKLVVDNDLFSLVFL